ncbi:MAG: phage integrase SAM-like domain and Arm DNA-binding domain-containing protein, partial [Bacteroidota bacterium]
MSLTIHFYIRPQKAKKNGEAPIYLRLTADKRKELSLGYSIAPEKWDSQRYCSKGRKPADSQLNNHIQSVIGSLRRIETNLMNAGERLTVDKVLRLYTGKETKGTRLLDFFDEVLEKLRATVGLPDGLAKGTLGKYVTTRKHLAAFISYHSGQPDMALRELELEHLKSFDFYLQTEKGIENNTRLKYITILRRIIREALEARVIERDPFIGWKGKRVQKERVRLTDVELQKFVAQ